MKRSVKVLVIFVLYVFVITSVARSTQVLYRSPQQLGQQSELVVRGTVASVESYWNNKHTKIFTTTRLDIAETYKGTDLPLVEIVQLGGVVGTVKVTVHGALAWRVGEEVLLFLEPYAAGTYQVSGFSQGKLVIRRDPRTGQAYVQRPASEGVELVGAPPSEPGPKASAVNEITLERFVNQALGGR